MITNLLENLLYDKTLNNQFEQVQEIYCFINERNLLFGPLLLKIDILAAILDLNQPETAIIFILCMFI